MVSLEKELVLNGAFWEELSWNGVLEGTFAKEGLETGGAS